MNFPSRLTLIFLVLTFTGCSKTSQADQLPEINDIRIEARESAQKEIPILVLFMSNYCHYCEIALDEFLLPMQRDPAFKDKVILRQVDTSSQHKFLDFAGNMTSSNAFASKMHIWGVPHIMLFDQHGNKLSELKGLLTLDFYNAYLEAAIEEATKKIRTGKSK